MDSLEEKYRHYLNKGLLEEYIAELSFDGIIWWFNMDIMKILCHLAPVEHIIEEEGQALPARLIFLKEATVPAISTDKMESLYRKFMDDGDLEAVAAVCGAGIASLWDHGRDFRSYGHWFERIEELLCQKERLTPLCVASLLAFKALFELDTNIATAYETCRKLRIYAEKAGSPSLSVYSASFAIYPLMWMGRLSEAEPIIKDTEVIYNLPEVNPVARACFEVAEALYYLVTDEPDRAEAILGATTSMAKFDNQPMTTYFLAYSHLLLALAWKGDRDAVEQIAHRLRSLVVPEKNYFHQAYLCYSLGIACLVTGEPYRALIYSREALERAELSGSNMAPLMAALLKGQALADTGRYEEAAVWLKSWLPKWLNSGFRLFAFTACVELSRIYYMQGMVDKARKALEEAHSLIPKEEKPILLHRTSDFFDKTVFPLFPSEDHVELIAEPQTQPIRIYTFGDLRIETGNRILYDRKWRSKLTNLLLKALIVFGGSKVPYEVLIDILWPDTDGDMAENNLKVTISRLRKLLSPSDTKPIQWILVNKKRISLARPLCWIDSIAFKEVIEKTLKGKALDTELLKKTIELYKDDFIANDNTATWLVKHRELLRKYYTKGVLHLGACYRKEGKGEHAIPHLDQAIRKDPLNEELYAMLMEIYLDAGYPSKALRVYKEAEERLQDELGIPPGFRLRRLAIEGGLNKAE